MIFAESDDDSLESHNLQSEDVNTNTSLTSVQDKAVSNKAKKFVVSLNKPTKISFQLPKRGQKKNHIPKFQIQNNVSRGNSVPVPRTRRPKLMQAKKFTSKPHAIDHAEEFIERSNFYKKHTQNNFNHFGNEDKHKITEKYNYKTKNSEHFEHRFQNFTDIDISGENDSDESKETEKKPLRRRYMKTAASDKVKAIATPLLTNVSTQRNYRIKELLKNQKYNPRVERKMVPILALQKGSGAITGGQNITTTSKNIEGSSTNRNNMASEEKDDQNEFIFIKEDKHKSSTTASLDDKEIVTIDPIIVI